MFFENQRFETKEGALYKLKYFVRPNGRCPTKEFLYSIQEVDLEKITAWLMRLRNEGYKLIYPYSGNASRKLKYLRVRKGSMVFRIFYFFDKDIIITVNGYVKKKDKLDPIEIARAERLRKEYLDNKS